ncbi:hypothetical protein [Devosia sp.]|uniref:hypothetical protein n=1 Tax=Devosia sp. TaxID=1871048 RepID=UPI001AC125F0|nr:hypothetical protein [Devosia sp.]MBN9308623.1 hypothetical protein [Devosia sp.]
MLHTAVTRLLPPVILGLALALPIASSVLAESRVVFQSSKDQVKKACDNIEGGGGVSVQGQGGKGYGCYNTNNGVLVACSDNGACTGYLPKGSPRIKALGNVLNFGVGVKNLTTESLGSGSAGGGSGDKGGNPCGPDGCLY